MAEIEVSFDNTKVEEFLKDLVKKTKNIDKSKELARNISPIIFRDVLTHFDKQVDSKGKKWPELTGWYGPWKEKKHPGRPKLVLSSRMRQAFNAGNIRTTSKGYEFFNPVEYSGDHDRGENGQKKREFMYLTDEGLNKVSQVMMAFLLDD